MSMAVAPPAPRFFRSEAPIEKTIRTTNSALQFSNRTDSKSGPWVWRLEKVQPVPFFHPLERTVVTIDSLSLNSVAIRISNFMKNHSITCSYHNEEGRVDCMTDALLRFTVQLWEGSQPNTFLMEVQRRQGCCVQMQHIRRLLTQAILDNVTSEPEAKPAEKTCEFLERMLPPLPPRQEGLPSALDCCKEMLGSERLDLNRLGLESLCTLTDSSKMLSKDAKQACHLILTDSTWQGLLEKYFMDMKAANNDTDDNSMEEDTATQYRQGEMFGSLHLMALKVLAQTLESSPTPQRSLPIDLDSMFWKTILQALYYNMQVASRRPLEASLSIRCLRLLQTLEPATLNLAPSQDSLQYFLSRAHQYGKDHNRSLEQETDQLGGARWAKAESRTAMQQCHYARWDYVTWEAGSGNQRFLCHDVTLWLARWYGDL